VGDSAGLRSNPSPRTLSAEDRRLLQVWMTAAADGVIAYISQRSSDDPAMIGYIVVLKRATWEPFYSVYCPLHLDLCIGTSLVEQSEVRAFPTLRAALNFIGPVLPT
jgi:hypothetical protein